MILIFHVLLGVGAGLLRRDRTHDLQELRLRYAWLPIAIFIIQWMFVIFPVADKEGVRLLGAWVLACTYGILLTFLILNRSLPGVKLIFLGATLNLIVMLANGGYMPVTPEALLRSGHEDHIVVQSGHRYVHGSKDIVLEKEDTRLYALSDVLGFPKTMPFSTNFSIGDLVIGVGAFWLSYRAIPRIAPKRVVRSCRT